MLTTLRQFFARRRRAIFRYHDGLRTRFGDPSAHYRALLEHPRFDWAVHPLLIEVPIPVGEDPARVKAAEKVSLEALGITADAVREAFDVPPVAAGGLTELECVRLLAAYADYLVAVKKNISGRQISPEPMAPKSSEPSTTSSRSASGSTPTASSAGAPSAS